MGRVGAPAAAAIACLAIVVEGCAVAGPTRLGCRVTHPTGDTGRAWRRAQTERGVALVVINAASSTQQVGKKMSRE